MRDRTKPAPLWRVRRRIARTIATLEQQVEDMRFGVRMAQGLTADIARKRDDALARLRVLESWAGEVAVTLRRVLGNDMSTLIHGDVLRGSISFNAATRAMRCGWSNGSGEQGVVDVPLAQLTHAIESNPATMARLIHFEISGGGGASRATYAISEIALKKAGVPASGLDALRRHAFDAVWRLTQDKIEGYRSRLK